MDKATALILLVHGNDLGPSCPRGDIRYPGANMGSKESGDWRVKRERRGQARGREGTGDYE